MLEVKELVKDFGGTTAISRTSFEIMEDELVAIVGPNGAGKTTLVNLISGYLTPDHGKITFMGRDITYASVYRRIKMGIGRSFQIIHLFEDQSVMDNVRTSLFSRYGTIRNPLLPAGVYKKVTRETLEILELVGLADRKEIIAKDLSEGDKKVLDIVIAFALRTKLLLLDEPTSGVATGDKFKVMDTIVAAIREQKMAAMIIEHDMDIVSDYSDRVMVLHEGKVMAEGKPEEIMNNREVQSTLFGVREPNAIGDR